MIDQTTVQQVREVDVFALAQRYGVTLHRCSTTEMAGACPNPNCTATRDGFHVNTRLNRWRCYSCHPEKWFDGAELVKSIEGCDYREAVRILTGDAAPTRHAAPKAPTPDKRPSWDAERSQTFLAQAQERLWGANAIGERARAYLESRGLDSGVWLAFGLGVANVKTGVGNYAPAIAMPWYAGENLVSLSFRFLEAQEGQRYTRWGSASHRLYGNHANLDAGSTLILCEGELNSLSIWQVAHHAGVHVLSTGKETRELSRTAVAAIVQRHQTIIVWQDKPEIARRIEQQLAQVGGCAVGVLYSHELPTGEKLDANALLQRGELGAVLSMRREQLADSPSQKQRLFADLLGAARTLWGLDSGSAAVLHRLSGVLSLTVTLEQIDGDRWCAV